MSAENPNCTCGAPLQADGECSAPGHHWMRLYEKLDVELKQQKTLNAELHKGVCSGYKEVADDRLRFKLLNESQALEIEKLKKQIDSLGEKVGSHCPNCDGDHL